MFGEEIFQIDLCNLYTMIGEIADRSNNDYDPNLSDLSDWLTRNNITSTKDLEKLPPSGVKNFVLSYLSGYDHKNTVTFFPRFDQVVYLPDPHMIEVVDLLIATTMLFDLVSHKRKEEEKGHDPSFDTDLEKCTKTVIWGNKRIWLTLDSTTFPLIKAMTYTASKLDLKLDRAKKRRTVTSENGALDPAMRIRYDLMRHTPPWKIFQNLRGTLTPLQGLAREISEWHCVYQGPNGLTHTRIGPALAQRGSFDPRSNDRPYHKIVDSYDVIRIQGQPA